MTEQISYDSRTWDEVQKELQAPTPRDRIEYLPLAIKRDGEGFNAVAAPYVDARFPQDRLDAVVGSFNWQSEAEVIAGLIVVRLGIRPPGRSEFVWRSDTGQDEPIADSEDDEGITGGRGIFSRGFKRCGYQWGIARDVYGMRRRRLPCAAKAVTRNGREAFVFSRWLEPRTAPPPERTPAPAPAPAATVGTPPVTPADAEALPPQVSTTDYFEEAKKLSVTPAEAAEFAKSFFSSETNKTDWRSALDALRREKA